MTGETTEITEKAGSAYFPIQVEYQLSGGQIRLCFVTAIDDFPILISTADARRLNGLLARAISEADQAAALPAADTPLDDAPPAGEPGDGEDAAPLDPRDPAKVMAAR